LGNHGNAKNWYDRFSKVAARIAGRSATFTAATAVILTWLITGPIFNFSDTWQLAINTATTIITFLMVFLIQHTQNIDSQATQIKMDEIIRATKGAHNTLLDIEEMTEKQLDDLREQYEQLARNAQQTQESEDTDPKSSETIHEEKDDT
jgi:low affinity Fe/Cu permease